MEPTAKLVPFALFLQAHTTVSLKCYSNYCAVGADGNATMCVVSGDGVHEDCGHPLSDDITMACFEEPIDVKSGQVKSRGCAKLQKADLIKEPGCSLEHGKSAKGYRAFGCVCFEDFCNNRFNNTIESRFRVVNGFVVQNSDNQNIHLMTTKSDDKLNELERSV